MVVRHEELGHRGPPPVGSPASRSDTATTRAAGGRPAEHARRVPVDDRGVRAAHAAHEQVEHAAEVPLGVVAGQPPAQEAVQHNGVQQRLQRVVGVQHRLGQPGRAVVGGGHRPTRLAEPVGLVVDHHEPRPTDPVDPGDPQHHVDRAGQVAAQRLIAERPAGPAGRRTPPAGRRPEQVPATAGATSRSRTRAARSRRSPPASGNSKSSSRSRSARPMSASVRPGRAVPAGSRAAAAAPRRAASAAARRPATSAAARETCVEQLGPQVGARAGSAFSSTACTRVPNVAPAGRSAIGETGVTTRRQGPSPGPARRRARRRAPARTARARPRSACLRLAADGRGRTPRPGSGRSRRCAASRRRSGGRTRAPASTSPRRRVPERARHLGDDRPLDGRATQLLDGAAARASTSSSSRRRLPVGDLGHARLAAEQQPVQAARRRCWTVGAHQATTWDWARVSAT